MVGGATERAHGPGRSPPLLDLLGTSFEFNTDIEALAWHGDAPCLGFANGTVALIASNWPGGPSVVPRRGGGVAITAGDAPPPPPRIHAAHEGAVIAMAAESTGSVISGGADGRLMHIADDRLEPLAERPRRRIALVAAGRPGHRAFACGRQVHLLGTDTRRVDASGPVRALAYDGSGLHLAIAEESRVLHLTSGARRVRTLDDSIGCATGPGALAWSPSGDAIAFRDPAGGVHVSDPGGRRALRHVPDERGAASISFTADGILAVAAGDSVRFWRLTGDEIAAAGEADAGAQIVALAAHPRLPVLAAGMDDGAIRVLHPLMPGSLAIRDDGAGIVHLAFSGDGTALAFADAAREAGALGLPDALFRTGVTG